jgi:ribosome-binding factor A
MANGKILQLLPGEWRERSFCESLLSKSESWGEEIQKSKKKVLNQLEVRDPQLEFIISLEKIIFTITALTHL